MSKTYWSQRIEELANSEKAVPDTVFFTSEAYRSYTETAAKDMITGVCGYLRRCGYSISEMEEDRRVNALAVEMLRNPEITAYTDGYNICIGTNNSLVTSLDSRELRHYAIQGFRVHEVAHILFTDFPTLKNWVGHLNQGIWWPKIPDRASEKDGAELTKRLKKPRFCKPFVSIARNIENALEDGFIEREIQEMYGGLATTELATLDEVQISESVSFGEMLKKKCSPFEAMLNQILLYAKYDIAMDDGIPDAVDVQGHNHGVIEAIGIEQEELVKKQAEIARAQAARDVACAKADAEMAANAKEVEAQTAIAKRNNELQLAKAKLKAEADKAAADADAAGQIQMNLRAKEIKEAEADAEIAKQKKMVDLAAQEAEVQQRKLDAEVRKQADADLYRRQKEAEAKKYEAERAAEAQKFSKQQEAEGIELVGKAEAEAIRQKGLAEAEAMKQKAEAYKQYNDAAVAEMLIKVLPDIAKSVAQPLSSIDKVSIIGGDASGVSGVSRNVPILMAQTMQTVKEATGIDMGEIVRANSIQAKTDRNINIMTQCEQPENNKEKGGAKAMERVEGGYLIHEKNLNGEEATHFRPDVTEEEKAIMKDKKAKD